MEVRHSHHSSPQEVEDIAVQGFVDDHFVLLTDPIHPYRVADKA